MKRLWLGLCLAFGMFGCGGGSGTFVLVTVQRGNAVGPVTSIDLTVMLDGKTDVRHLSDKGAEIVLPTTATLRINSGAGRLKVIATGMTAGGQVMGSAEVDVVRDQTENLTVTFGADTMAGDAGVPDGGSDGGLSPDGGGTGADLTLDKLTQAFGGVVTGQTGSATFVLRNGGGATSGTISAQLGGSGAAAYALAAGSTCAGQTLTPGSTCSLVVTFAPTTAGTFAGTLSVSASPGGTPLATLTGMGLAPGALMMGPTSHDFGAVLVGQDSGSFTFTATNTGGTATGTLAASLSGTDASAFALGSDGCTGQTIAAGAVCTLTVRFSPTGGGGRTASLIVTGSPGGSATASVTGTGQRPAVLGFVSPTLNFPTTAIGSSNTLTYSLANSGDAASGALGTPAVSGTDAAQFAVVSGGTCTTAALAGGTSCTIMLRFTPTSGGTKSAALSVAASPGGTATASPITGATPPAMVTLSPASGSFANTLIGVAAATDSAFTVSNPGGMTAGPLALSVSPGSYTLTTVAGDCMNGTVLPPGVSCPVHVRFTPALRGANPGTLSVTASPGGAPTATLSGMGLKPATLTTINSGGGASFGTVFHGTSSGVVQWVIQNTGDVATGAVSYPLTNLNGQGFFIAGTDCAATIGPGVMCNQFLQWVPQVPGNQSVQYNASASPGGTCTMIMVGQSI